MASITRSERPHRHPTRALVRAAGFLAMCAPVYWVLDGRAESVQALVPTDQMLRFSDFIAEASSAVIVLLLVGVIAASVLVWLAMCAVFSAYLSGVELVHRSASRRRMRSRRVRGARGVTPGRPIEGGVSSVDDAAGTAVLLGCIPSLLYATGVDARVVEVRKRGA